MLVTLVSWGVWGVLLRVAPPELSPAQCQALSTIGLAPIVLLLARLPDAEPAGDRRVGIAYSVASGVVSSLGNVAFYAALELAPASIVVPLTAMSPAVAVLLAWVLLGEQIAPWQWLGIALSLLAIGLFNLTPGDGGSLSRTPLALIPLVLWGVTLLLQKLATRTLSGRAAALWFLISFVPVGLAILVWSPLAGPVSPTAWLVTFALGFTLALGNVTILWALAAGGPTSIVAPLSGLYPLVSIPLAVGLLGETLGKAQWVGAAAAIVAVALLTAAPDAVQQPSEVFPEQESLG
jgi:drug/metabolite transporter (DMT)-like permease